MGFDDAVAELAQNIDGIAPDVLVVLKVMEFVEIFVFKTILMRPFDSLDQSFLNYRLWVGWLFRDYAVFAEDVVPGSDQCGSQREGSQ